MSSTKLQSVVQRQLPEFIREDYPKFLAFIKAYYEYMDTLDDRNIIELRDIDSTVDSFIDYFKGEIGFNVPNIEFMDMRLFLRKSKQAFTVKGTEESYKFLFRILFDKPVTITYPWDSVLKASDGKWQRDTSIFIEFPEIMEVAPSDIIIGNTYKIIQVGTTDFTLCGSPNNLLNTSFVATAAGTGTGVVTTTDENQAVTAVNSFIGNQVTVTGTGKFIKVFVDKIKKVRTRVYELSIDKNYYGDIELTDVVVYNNYSVPICPTTIDYKVISAGKNYRVGDLLHGTTIANGVTIEQTLKVIQVNSEGGIIAIVPVKYGCGYTDNFYLLSSKKAVSVKSAIGITRDSSPVYNSPESGVDGYVDSGTILNPDYFEDSYTNPTYAGTVLQNFYNETVNNIIDMADMALIEFIIGGVAKYQGYYISNDGFLSDAIKLQDSKFYQKYSYVITIDETIESYRSYVKAFLHSAGMAMYGEYQITNTYDPGISGRFILGL